MTSLTVPPRVLIHLTASEYGGVETHVYHLALVLRQAGVQVALTSQRQLAFNQAWVDDLRRSGVELVAPPAAASRMRGIAGLAITRAWLRWRLSRRSFNMVIGQGHGGAFAWMKHFVGPNGLLVWHEYWYGVPAHGDNYSEYKVPAAAPFGPRMRRMVSQLDAIVTGCERARTNLEAVQRVSAPLALIAPLTHLAGVPEAVERQYDEACLVRVVMTGRMGFGKGLGVLLRVWEGLEIGNAELHLYGPLDSDFAQRAARRSEEHRRIYFHGPFDRETLPNLLSQADLGLMLSIEEGYGLVAWEYMACGLPFVITDCGAADEFTAGNSDALKIPVSEEGVRIGIETMVSLLRANRLSRRRLQALHRRDFSYERASAMHVQAVVDPGVIWPALRNRS